MPKLKFDFDTEYLIREGDKKLYYKSQGCLVSTPYEKLLLLKKLKFTKDKSIKDSKANKL